MASKSSARLLAGIPGLPFHDQRRRRREGPVVAVAHPVVDQASGRAVDSRVADVERPEVARRGSAALVLVAEEQVQVGVGLGVLDRRVGVAQSERADTNDRRRRPHNHLRRLVEGIAGVAVQPPEEALRLLGAARRDHDPVRPVRVIALEFDAAGPEVAPVPAFWLNAVWAAEVADEVVAVLEVLATPARVRGAGNDTLTRRQHSRVDGVLELALVGVGVAEVGDEGQDADQHEHEHADEDGDGPALVPSSVLAAGAPPRSGS